MSERLRVYTNAEFAVDDLTSDPALEVHGLTRAEMEAHGVEDLRGYDALVTFRHELTADVLADLAAHGLRYVMRPGAGYDTVDVPAATEHGVLVNHAPQGPANAVVEGTIGLIISCLRSFHVHNAHLRERGFEGRWELPASELQGSTVGLLGLGLIGRGLAEHLGRFGATLQAHDPYVDAAVADRLDVDLVDLDDLLETSDVVSIHVPLTDETRGMLGAEDFRRMRDTAYLVNAARGGIYPDADLAEAIREGWIAGAAVDVFEDEADLSGNPLLALGEDEALLTPHVLGPTDQAMARIVDLVVEAVSAMRDGGVPPNVLNPEAYDGEVPEDRRSPAF